MSTEISTSENVQDEFDLHEVMERIRARAEERRANSLLDTSAILAQLLNGNGSGGSSSPVSLKTNGYQLQPDLEARDQYRVEDLLGFNDRAFVRNAYRAILQREPDDAGFTQYLAALRSGRLNKIDILGKLRFSEEGRLRNVQIEGLNARARGRLLYRTPVVGYVLEWIVAIARLPKLVANYRSLEAHTAAQDERVAEMIADAVARLTRQIEQINSSLTERFGDFREAQRQLALLNQNQIKALIREQRELIEDANQLKKEISAHNDQVASRFDAHKLTDEIQLQKHQELEDLISNQIVQKLQRTRAELVLQERRLLELRERVPASGTTENGTRAEGPADRDDLLDLLLSSLEDQFRGSRADIKEALQVYLPILTAANIKTEILDVGCGRGEWLELLTEQGFSATGIDVNRIAVRQCQELQLDAREADLLSHLAELPDNSLNCITAFHVAEHLPLDVLVRFLDASLRVLRQGGMLIIETPNPKNLIVSSCNFYFDPTHRHPLPRETMECMLEARGFARLKTLELHPMLSEKFKGSDELSHRWNEHFYGPMDYAVVAHKP